MLIPIILAGGSGTRLWPLSRSACPKQFIELLGERTLFQQAFDRLEGLPELQTPYVVCQEEYRFLVAEQLRSMGACAHILLEPEPKNTAPAIALAALSIQKQVGDLDPLLLCLSADHLIVSPHAFQKSVVHGMSYARRGPGVIFGVKPTTPHTGYGYIHRGQAVNDYAYAVSQFVEKPSYEVAEQYCASGEYYWNCGLFLFKLSTILAHFKQHAPDILEIAESGIQHSTRDGDFIRPLPSSFMNMPERSIDYAIMEKAKDIVVVPLLSEWHDVGSWNSLAECMPSDSQGNTEIGDVVLQDTQDCYVQATSRLVSLVGVSHLVVVETDDAVLVMDKDKSQLLKTVVADLKIRKRPEVSLHRKVNRPWGSFELIDEGARFQVKRLIVKVGGQLSLQMHHHRSEHWVVVKGSARVTRNDEVFLLTENQSTYIPVGASHRLENIGKIPLELIEVQSGSYLGEDDIIRLEDVYGRMQESVSEVV